MRKKILIGVLVAVFLLMIPVHSAVEFKTMKNNLHALIQEKQKNNLNNQTIRKELIVLTNEILPIFMNLILLDHLAKKNNINNKEINLNDLNKINEEIVSFFYKIKEFIQKHELSMTNTCFTSRYSKLNKLMNKIDFNSSINNIEKHVDELKYIIKNNPEKLDAIENLRILIAFPLWLFLTFFDFIYSVLYPVILITLSFFLLQNYFLFSSYIFLIGVSSLPFTLWLTCFIVCVSGGTFSFLDAWNQIPHPLLPFTYQKNHFACSFQSLE